MTTKVHIVVEKDQQHPVAVLETFTGQRTNRQIHVVFPGQSREFSVHNNLTLQVMEVQPK